MQVRLKVLQGSKAGKEIKLTAPKCLIGRSDECHLRPQSDAISRRHCVILISDTEVAVRDLGSRNGTHVNGEKLTEEAILLSGDMLRVGSLEFQVVIEQSILKPKRSAVTDIKEVAARTVEGSSGNVTADLGNIDQWLLEADEDDKQKRIADPDTRQFRMDESAATSDTPAPESAASDTKSILNTEVKRPEKQPPKKLPPKAPGNDTKDSREAAANMLKRFFNRR